MYSPHPYSRKPMEIQANNSSSNSSKRTRREDYSALPTFVNIPIPRPTNNNNGVISQFLGPTAGSPFHRLTKVLLTSHMDPSNSIDEEMGQIQMGLGLIGRYRNNESGSKSNISSWYTPTSSIAAPTSGGPLDEVLRPRLVAITTRVASNVSSPTPINELESKSRVVMKLDDDLGRDRGDDFQTDDEENEAELVYGDEDYTESEDTVSSPSPSVNNIDLNDSTWPQSYRQSISRFTTVAPPPLNFLRKTSLTGISSFFSTAQESPEASEHDSLLSKPLISETSIDKEEVPTSILPVKISGSACSKFSTRKSPPPQEQCSLAQAVINGINVLCGIGLLTTPYAVKEGGWFSLIILVMMGLISCYTAFLLKRCLESSPELQTYPDIGEAAFGLAGRFGIAIVLYIELYASCVEYIIMMSDNLASLYPDTQIRFAGTYLGSRQVFSITATLIVLPTVWLRNLSLLSYLSGGGVVASILVALCLLWVGVVDRVGFHPCGTALDLANISVSIGIFSYSFSGHPVFPNIYTSMKEPSQFPSVLIASFVFCFFMYIGVAICGFLMFGDSVKSQFTLNMPREYVASNIAIWTVVVNPLTKYALTLTPISLSLEELLPSAQLRSFSVVLLVRTILVFSTLVVALTVPYFASVMALMGSLLTMLVTFIFPCACYLRILKGKLTKLQIANSIIILSVASVCLCIGTYSAVIRISEKIA